VLKSCIIIAKVVNQNGLMVPVLLLAAFQIVPGITQLLAIAVKALRRFEFLWPNGILIIQHALEVTAF